MSDEDLGAYSVRVDAEAAGARREALRAIVEDQHTQCCPDRPGHQQACGTHQPPDTGMESGSNDGGGTPTGGGNSSTQRSTVDSNTFKSA